MQYYDFTENVSGLEGKSTTQSGQNNDQSKNTRVILDEGLPLTASKNN